MSNWTEGGILTFGAAAGILLSIPLVWVCDRIAARIRLLREQRSTLASLRPRRTVELAQTHRRIR